MTDKITNKITKIVLTGGPCAGKTTAMARIIEHFSSLGFQVFAIPEVPTMFSSAGINYLTHNKALFFEAEKSTLNIQLALEDHFAKMAEQCNKPVLIVCDRGTMDISAYVSPEIWEALTEEMGTNTVKLRDARYEAILHMVTAAAGAAEHRGHLGDGEHLEAQAAEVLDNPGHRRRLAGTGATGQHNLSDFIGDLISHLVNDNSGFTKRKPKIHTIFHPHNLSILKDVKSHAKPPACYCQEQIPQRHQKTMFFFPSSSVLLARHAQRIRSSGCKHYSYEPLRQCEADKHSRDGYHRGRETNNDLQNNYSKVNCCSDSP